MLRMIESCFNLAWVVNECFLTLPLSFRQMWSSTPWSFHLLTNCLSVWLSGCLTVSGRKLEISVNIDAGTLKFCMRHPLTQSLRFRESQIFCMSVSLLVVLLFCFAVLYEISGLIFAT